MVFWRSLTKEEFEVKTTCTRSGEILLESANFWDRKVSKEDERPEGEEQVRVQKIQSDDDVGHENKNNDNSQLKDEEEDRVEDGVRYERNYEDSREHNLRVRTAKSMKEISLVRYRPSFRTETTQHRASHVVRRARTQRGSLP